MPKTNLSKNLLDMKFMKKSKEKVEIEKLENERKILFDSEVTESMRKVGKQYIMEPSYVSCEDLIAGRMSFRGANLEIEQMMRDAEILKEDKEIAEREALGTISAEEMADRYSTLIGTVGNKFKTRRQRTAPEEDEHKGSQIAQPVTKKKKKFLKPSDE